MKKTHFAFWRLVLRRSCKHGGCSKKALTFSFFNNNYSKVMEAVHFDSTKGEIRRGNLVGKGFSLDKTFDISVDLKLEANNKFCPDVFRFLTDTNFWVTSVYLDNRNGHCHFKQKSVVLTDYANLTCEYAEKLENLQTVSRFDPFFDNEYFATTPKKGRQSLGKKSKAVLSSTG